MAMERRRGAGGAQWRVGKGKGVQQGRAPVRALSREACVHFIFAAYARARGR